jgi:hypothetical protein
LVEEAPGADRSGLPNICLVDIVDGRPLGSIVCPAFLAERGGQTVVITHMVALDGSVWVLHKNARVRREGPAARRGRSA